MPETLDLSDEMPLKKDKHEKKQKKQKKQKKMKKKKKKKMEKMKTADIPLPEKLSDSDNSVAKTKTPSQASSKSRPSTPKVKGPQDLYPYIKEVGIKMNKRQLNQMSEVEQYQFLVKQLTEAFEVCHMALPSINKTSSAKFKCTDLKWTKKLCKEVANKYELYLEAKALEMDQSTSEDDGSTSEDDEKEEKDEKDEKGAIVSSSQ